MIDWLRAFAVTLLVELPIYAALLRRWCRPRAGLGLGLLVNAITHPALWFALRAVGAGGWSWALAFLLAEATVVLVEGGILVVALRRRGARPGDLFAVAAFANLASAGVGLILQLR